MDTDPREGETPLTDNEEGSFSITSDYAFQAKQAWKFARTLELETARQQEEIAALKHDISRHVRIAAEQAGEIAGLRGQLELRDAEDSSAGEAINVLFKALNWNSGGLGAAATEVCDRLASALSRIGALTIERDEAITQRHHFYDSASKYMDERDAALSRIQSLEKDAERYEWLVAHARPVFNQRLHSGDTASTYKEYDATMTAGSWDEISKFIDAAIDALKTGEK